MTRTEHTQLDETDRELADWLLAHGWTPPGWLTVETVR